MAVDENWSKVEQDQHLHATVWPYTAFSNSFTPLISFFVIVFLFLRQIILLRVNGFCNMTTKEGRRCETRAHYQSQYVSKNIIILKYRLHDSHSPNRTMYLPFSVTEKVKTKLLKYAGHFRKKKNQKKNYLWDTHFKSDFIS